MSTFANDVLDPARLAARAGTTIGRPPVSEFADDDEPDHVRTDRMISENRARTPSAVSDLRAVQRLSIREINELDSEEIQRRLAKIRRDDRSPTEQVIDLIDLPRNLVMNAAAPGLARKAREAGNTGTFGLGRVSAADALEAMGVENRIVRGIVGFAGDVALDPLTYVGPAGWGAQLSGKAASASIRAGGRRALRRSIAEAAAGRTVRDAEVGAYLKAKGLFRQAGEDAAAAHDRIAKGVYGDITEGIGTKAFVPFGADRIRTGGDLVNDLFSTIDSEASRAARDIYAKYGRGTRGLGPVGGSEVAHIPFTDISLRTKPFTNEARAATEAHRLAKLRDTGITEQMLSDIRAAAVAPDVLALGTLSDDVREGEVAAQAKRAEFDAREQALRTDHPDDDGLPPEAGSADDVPPTAGPSIGGEAPAGGQQPLDSGVGLRDAPVSSAADGAGAAQAGRAPEAARPNQPAARKPAGGEFSKADIERRLTDWYDQNAGTMFIDPNAAPPGEDLGGYRISEGGQVATNFSTSFAGNMPTEVREYIQGQPKLRRLIKENVPGGRGADSYGELGDEWFRRLEASAGSAISKALDQARSASGADPEAHFLSFLHDNLPMRQKNRLPYQVVDAPAESLPDGAMLSIAGKNFAVIGDGPEKLLVEQVDVVLGPDDIDVTPEGMMFYLGGLDRLPVDEGSLRMPSSGADLSAQKLVPGQQLGLLGERFNGGITGEQGTLGFSAPSQAAQEAESMRSPVHPSEANTGKLFDGGNEPPPPPSAGTALPDPNDGDRARLAMERAEFEQNHAAEQSAKVARAREVAERAKAAVLSGDALGSIPGGSGVGHELALHDAYIDAAADVRRAEAVYRQAALARTLSALNRDADDSIRQLKLVGNEDIAEDLWAIATTNPERADELVDIAQKGVETAAMQAEVYHSALSNLLTNPETILLDRTKQLIGTGDSWVAASLFAPLGRMAAGRLEDDHWAVQAMERFDRTIRNSVGVRGGSATRFLARQKAAIRHGGEELKRVDYAVRDRVAKALAASGKDTPQNRATTLQLAWAKAHGENYHRWRFDPKGPQKAADGSLTNPSAMTRLLLDAQRDGLLTDAAIAKEIDAIVGDFGQAMRSMGDEELQQGLIGALMPDYVPIVPTTEFRDASQARKEAFGSLGEGSSEKTFRGAQPFQRQRMTMQTRFQPPNSTTGWQRFFEGDRYMLEGFEHLPPEQRLARAEAHMVEQMNRRYATNPGIAAERIAEKSEALRAIVAYDEMVKADPAIARAFPPMPTDGMELNELFTGGRFDYLIGRDEAVEAFAETDLATVWANRTMQHHVARAVSQFTDLLRHSLVADPLLLAQNLNGKSAVTATGIPIRVLESVDGRGGSKTFNAMINGERYRTLDARIRTDAADHPLLKTLFGDASNQMDGRLFPAPMADAMEDFVLALQPEKMQELLQVVDTLQGFWKMYTLSHASWPIFNVVGNSMLALMGGANPANMVKHAKSAARIRSMINNPEALAKLTLNIRGQEVNGADLIRQAIDAGVVNNNISLELAAQHARQDPGMLAAGDRMFRRVLAPWFAANQAADDIVRMTAWMSHIEDGADPMTAAARTLSSMFDYSDFTRVEERVFRRVFPFYSWIRSNLGFQLKSLVEQPMWAALAPKLQEAIEQAAAGEDRVPENLRPRWMRDSLATQLNSDPKGRIGLMLGQNILPQSDLVNVLAPAFGLDGAQKFAHFLGSSVSPIYTKPFEVAFGRDLFSGREIGGDTGWSSFALGAARPIAEFGAAGTAAGAAGALAGQAVGGPIGNIAGGLIGSQAASIGLGAALGEGDASRLLSGRVGVSAGKGSIGQAITRANLGGRVQAMDDDRLASSVRREFKDKERKLRSRIGALHRTGQSTTDAMADLMALYRDATRDGMDDVVPKWARAELSAPASAAGATAAAR